jgi:hypothetical protein
VQLPRVLHLPSRGPQDCRCGHSSLAHEHYRRGNDCALCKCAKFKAASQRRRDTQAPPGEQAHAA